ncbi:MAG: metallophosphoesterase family protein [Bacteroidota bacterium]
MRIAILSDIHSNLQALQSTLEYVSSMNLDALYCLGDIVGYGANPNECIELIRRHATHVVRGNHDQAMYDSALLATFSKPGRIASEWNRRQLVKENLDYLAALPLKIETDCCTLAHSAPTNPEAWEYVASLDSAERQFAAFSTQICFIGHTHQPIVCGEDLETFDFKAGVRFLINVGSVGQPRDHNPQSSFGYLDTGSWEYRNFRLDYEIEKAAKAIKVAGLPRFLGKRLSVGM